MKIGEWERIPNNDNGVDFRCSACHGFRFHNGELRKYKFCPMCGARMSVQMEIDLEQTDCAWR